MPRRDKPEWAACPSCGKLAVRKGLLGGACQACGKGPREVALEQQGYDRFGQPVQRDLVSQSKPIREQS